MMMRPLRHGAGGLSLSSVLAAGLILDLGGPFPLRSQEPARPSKGVNRADEPKVDLKPEARLGLQKIRTRKARAQFDMARLSREIAELAIEEYLLGTYAQDLATVEAEIKTTEAELDRADDRLEQARRMFKKGQLSERELSIAENLSRACRFALEMFQARKKVLVMYTREKEIKEREAEVKKARKLEGDMEAAWKREARLQAELECQIECP